MTVLQDMFERCDALVVEHAVHLARATDLLNKVTATCRQLESMTAKLEHEYAAAVIHARRMRTAVAQSPAHDCHPASVDDPAVTGAYDAVGTIGNKLDVLRQQYDECTQLLWQVEEQHDAAQRDLLDARNMLRNAYAALPV